MGKGGRGKGEGGKGGKGEGGKEEGGRGKGESRVRGVWGVEDFYCLTIKFT